MPIEIFFDRGEDGKKEPPAKTRIECICTLPRPDRFADEGGEIWLTVYVANKTDLTDVTNRLKDKFPEINEQEWIASHAVMHDNSARYARPDESAYLHMYKGEFDSPPNHHKHYWLSKKLEADAGHEAELFNQAKTLLTPLIIT